MSKQSEAKEKQGYDPKPAHKTCSNCAHFQFDRDWPDWMKSTGYEHLLTEKNKKDVNMRCGIGGFAVKRTATCREWRAKQ